VGTHRARSASNQLKLSQPARRVHRMQLRSPIRPIRAIRGPTANEWVVAEFAEAQHGRWSTTNYSNPTNPAGAENVGRYRACSGTIQLKQPRPAGPVHRMQLRSPIRPIRAIRGPTTYDWVMAEFAETQHGRWSTTNYSNPTNPEGAENVGTHRARSASNQLKLSQPARRVHRMQLRSPIRPIRAIRGPTTYDWVMAEFAETQHGRWSTTNYSNPTNPEGAENVGTHRARSASNQLKLSQPARRVQRMQLRPPIRLIRAIRGPTTTEWVHSATSHRQKLTIHGDCVSVLLARVS
jgi:predicted component of type VI protein secretion system